MFINSLDYTLRYKIFSYLSFEELNSVQEICKEWKQISDLNIKNKCYSKTTKDCPEWKEIADFVLTKRTGFDFIPDELIVHIFSYLSANELWTTLPFVSKRWNQISSSEDLWKDLFNKTIIGLRMSLDQLPNCIDKTHVHSNQYQNKICGSLQRLEEESMN